MELGKELLKGNTPTLVLSVLRDGALHGYAIAREIERRSDNALKFKEGTLYPALHALERDGLIEGSWDQSSSPARKVYTLTSAGHKELTQRTRVWQGFVAAMSGVMRGEAHGSKA